VNDVTDTVDVFAVRIPLLPIEIEPPIRERFPVERVVVEDGSVIIKLPAHFRPWLLIVIAIGDADAELNVTLLNSFGDIFDPANTSETAAVFVNVTELVPAFQLADVERLDHDPVPVVIADEPMSR